jgi:hypothetical protein
MEMNAYKYKAQLEKMYNEGFSDALARLRAAENDKNYYGDELVAKVKKHDGSEFYYVRDCVFEEMMRYITLLKEVAETVYTWDHITGQPKELAKRDICFMYFVKSVIPNEIFFESMKKCYKGSPMMNFYRDVNEIETNKNIETMKQAVVELWSF